MQSVFEKESAESGYVVVAGDASITPVPTEEPAASIEQRQLEPEVAGSSPEEDTKISIPEEMPKDVVSLTQQQTIISLSEEAPKEQV